MSGKLRGKTHLLLPLPLWERVGVRGIFLLSPLILTFSHKGRREVRFCLSIFAICLLTCRFVRADAPQDLFRQANAAYAQGQFTQAVSLYESARAQGLHHWILYYNLGNAYYKSDQVGKAIASYERAFRIDSGQGDVVHNLNLALTKAGDPLLPPGALARFCWRLFFWFSLNTLTMGTSLIVLAVYGGTGLLFFGRWRPSAELALGVCMTGAALILWLGMRIASVERAEAIVVANVAEVRSGPNQTYPASFTVPEGRRVLVLEGQEPVKGWIEIGVPQEGLKGWVPESSIEKV